MKVLVACEFSGTVRDAFIRAGHDAMSCDLLPSESDFGPHYQGDVKDILRDGWDLMIAHPPCTYLANSGVRWLYEQEGRRDAMLGAADFFWKLLTAPIPHVVIENPIQHRHCMLPRPTQIVQPWMFGDNQTKAVCLWLSLGLPHLVPAITKKPDNVEAKVWRMAPGPNRQKERSRFFIGIANAMAEQWGNA